MSHDFYHEYHKFNYNITMDFIFITMVQTKISQLCFVGFKLYTHSTGHTLPIHVRLHGKNIQS